MNEDIKIPELVIYECERGHKVVSQVDQTIVCQDCINDFLARNVGVMKPVVAEPPHEAPSMQAPPLPPQGVALADLTPEEREEMLRKAGLRSADGP